MHVPHDVQSIASGALGALWLIGLWLGAPLLLRPARTATLRVAAALALGCAVPLVLGLCDLLYGWSLWMALAAIVASRYVRDARTPSDSAQPPAKPWDLVAAFAVLLALAWPVAVRPVLDGDTLIYHLPNAASWAVHHGVWTTGTRYWWYPPASELFASALFLIGGAGVVGLSGLFPAVLRLLVFRSAAVRHGAHPLVGTSVACALLATPVASVQIVSLQNDLWLTALFLCGITEFYLPAAGTLALTKPNGIVFAIVVALTWLKDRAQTIEALCVALPAVGVWAIRDFVLLRGAIVPPASTWMPGTLATSIAAHFPHALVVLAAASWHSGIPWTVFLALDAASIVLARNAFLRWAAIAATVVFLVVPFGYESTTPQLATGASLRFALPVAALGGLWLSSLGRRSGAFVVSAASIATLYGIGTVWSVFYNDGTTRSTPFVLAVATLFLAACLRIASPVWRRARAGTLFVVLIAAAADRSRSHPGDYVADAYGRGGVPAGGFAFAAASGADPVVTLGLPAGGLVTLKPALDVYDGLDSGTCTQARKLRALILASAQRARDVDCGRVLYRDAASVVIDPARRTSASR